MIRRKQFVEPVVPMHVPDDELERLIDKLDRAQSHDSHRKSAPRIPYRRRGVVLSIEHPGHSCSVVSVWTRSVSTQAVSLVLGAFLHPGTRCSLDLPRCYGTVQPIHGYVRWCRLVEGIVHEVAIQFDAPLELQYFVNVAVLREYLPQENPRVQSRSDPEDQMRLLRDLLGEVEGLFEFPRLSKAVSVCRRLSQLADHMDWLELSSAANEVLRTVRSTGSIARAETQLRKLLRIGSGMIESLS